MSKKLFTHKDRKWVRGNYWTIEGIREFLKIEPPYLTETSPNVWEFTRADDSDDE